MRTISICLTSWNRDSMVFEAFKQVIDDERVSEIVIVDDCSEQFVYDNMVKICSHPKVNIHRNGSNMDCYRNKRMAVELSSNQFLVLLDSDNIITKSYIDAIYAIPEWDDRIAYQPSFAKPHFDFSKYAGLQVRRTNVSSFMHDSTFSTMLNAMNYFVNRDTYIRVWDGSIDPVTADSIYQNYRWLMFNNEIYVVPGMEYEHRVHNGSHYQNNNHRTGHWMRTITDQLKNMR